MNTEINQPKRQKFGAADGLLLLGKIEELERKLTDLLAAAIKYYNEAPREGDYALMLLSLSGTVKPDQPKMMSEYNVARKALRDAIESAQVEQK